MLPREQKMGEEEITFPDANNAKKQLSVSADNISADAHKKGM